jgi:hypothetical protein
MMGSNMMDGMWGMGLGGVLILVVVVLVAAVAIKYLFFDKRRDR